MQLLKVVQLLSWTLKYSLLSLQFDSVDPQKMVSSEFLYRRSHGFLNKIDIPLVWNVKNVIDITKTTLALPPEPENSYDLI